LSGREVLTHAGKISHEQAVRKAELEFEKHRALRWNEPSPAEVDFDKAVKQIEAEKPQARKGKQ
jgi:hypothetical protein